MLKLLIVQLGRMLPLTSSYRCQLRSSLATSESLLGVQIFSMNIRGQREGEQRASLQTLPGMEKKLGIGAGTAPLEMGAACCPGSRTGGPGSSPVGFRHRTHPQSVPGEAVMAFAHGAVKRSVPFAGLR